MAVSEMTVPGIEQIVELAMREIVSAAHRAEGSYVRTPLLYPSGSEVVVRISGGPNDFFVTDFGAGYLEAEMMGAPRSYVRQATIVSRNAGVSFDCHSFFAVRVSLDTLPGAIVTIANCSHEAVALTAFKLAERASAEGAELMVEKLERVFGVSQVQRRAKIYGASNHEWEFDAFVQAVAYRSVFEFASPHATSIASVAMKMNDVARLEGAPRRIVMVHSKPLMGTYLGVLAQASSVIEEFISDSRIRSLADAA